MSLTSKGQVKQRVSPRIYPGTTPGVILWLLLLGSGQAGHVTAAAADAPEVTEGSMDTPTIRLRTASSGASTRLEPGYFSLTTTGAGTPAFPVTIDLAFQESLQALQITFEFLNDDYVAQNNVTQDNAPLWRQEVFELFLAAGTDDPADYVELQVNPNGALFSARVSNPDGKGTANSLDFFDGRQAGIRTTVTKEEAAWGGTITLPLSILGSLQDHYRLNFFRIVSLQSHDPAGQWACTGTTCAFLAWSPTVSGASPAFHVPARFGHLILE